MRRRLKALFLRAKIVSAHYIVNNQKEADNVQLNKRQYNSKIQIYYEGGNLNYDLAKEIIRYVWLNQQGGKGKFELIQDTKADVYKLEYHHRIYYVKSYKFRSAGKILKNLFRPVEAVRYFETALKLLQFDIATAKPVLALTCQKNFFLVDSIFVLEEVPGADLSTYLDQFSNEEARQLIIKKLAVIWGKLINHKFLHLDPRLVNFIICNKTDDIHIRLIDIDSIAVLPFLPFKMILVKNLTRLNRRLLSEFSTIEINLFFEEFIKNCQKEVEIGILQEIYQRPSSHHKV